MYVWCVCVLCICVLLMLAVAPLAALRCGVWRDKTVAGRYEGSLVGGGATPFEDVDSLLFMDL